MKTTMKRAFFLPVILTLIAMTMAFPAPPAVGGAGAAPARDGGPLFSLAPGAAYNQASGPVISGVARNEAGSAVPGVVVNAENPSSHAVVATATTNPAGAYSLQVPAGTFDVKASPPAASGLQGGTYAGLSVSTDVDLDILFIPANMVTFSGRVLDRNGAPVPNQTVHLKRTPFGKTASTDDQGLFSMKVPPGDYTIEVISGLFVVPPNVPANYQVTRSGTVTLSGNTTMDITLNQVYLSGKVTADLLGVIPVPGTIVHVSGNTTFGAFSGRFDSYATTDALGKYSAVIFPCASLTIEATPLDVLDIGIFDITKVEGVSALSDTTKNVVLDGAVTCSGKLRDRSGNPIPGQNVTLTRDGFSKGATTNEEGSYDIKAKSGTYSIEVSNGFLANPANAPTTFKLTRTSTVYLWPVLGATANLALSEVYLGGTVLNSSGAPVPDVQLHFSASGTFGSFSGSYDSYATSDSAGNYSAVILPSSSMTVEATPPDTSACAYTRTSMSVTADGTRNITLADPVTFSGSLLDRDGDPVPYQYVSLEKAGYSKLGSTDAAGAFAIGVPTGDYTVKVISGFLGAPDNIPSSFQVAWAGTVAINGSTTMDINLSEAYVTGKVVGPAGAVSGVQVGMAAGGTWGDLSGSFDSRRSTDGQGAFSAVVFPSSSLILETIPPDATGYGPGQAVNVDVSGDKSLLVILCESNDVTPPATVNNLAVTAAYDVSAALSWTAPGDNGTYAGAAAYDIRYSTSPITEANWNAAAQCAGEPAPKAPGQPEAFLVSGLSPNTAYYFALKAGDEVPNWSGLSNVVQATTGAPVNLTVTGVTPDTVSQFSWFVDLTITGTGFQPGATVKLTMGDAVIDASNVKVVSENEITCSLLVLAQSPGAYDVVVTNPSGKEARLLFAFWIGVSCGQGSATGILMLGLSLGLLSLAGSARRWRRRRRNK